MESMLSTEVTNIITKSCLLGEVTTGNKRLTFVSFRVRVKEDNDERKEETKYRSDGRCACGSRFKSGRLMFIVFFLM